MSYTKLLYHVVFRTKKSVPAISVLHEKELYNYIWAFLKNKGCVLYRIGGMPDHIHILMQTPPTMALSDLIRDLKSASHKYLVEHRLNFPFYEGWGKSYCALSVSEKDRVVITNYIINQKEHHKSLSFQEELSSFLKEYGIDVDMAHFPE